MTLPPALKHGSLTKFREDLYWVQGCVKLKAPHPKFGPLTMQFSRNMTIIRDNDELTLVNSVRLDEQTLKELETLGEVKHVVRLAAFHGMDDPFYQQRYGTTMWSVDAPYFHGVNPNQADSRYFTPDEILSADHLPPLKGLRYFEIGSGKLNEGLFWLERDQGIAIAGDSLQNWTEPDAFFNLTAKFMMKKMGFFAHAGIGPGWMQAVKPNLNELNDFFDWSFEALIPSHGSPIEARASEAYRASVKKLIEK
ncbi:hypothetical protein F0266_20775 [Vibrio coralliilyticus]|uniref:hypothetical protein n=1 Tax=Vibrio coralliilyticus TaxID=190893 RepID=UPI00148D3EDA|nr:hypothetical protein [Vibrio coralliilyticus]NOH55376.1 hypothetical protein [Vibrio coralliilyticus]